MFEIDKKLRINDSLISTFRLQIMGVSSVLKGVTLEGFWEPAPEPQCLFASLAINSNSLPLPAAPGMKIIEDMTKWKQRFILVIQGKLNCHCWMSNSIGLHPLFALPNRNLCHQQLFRL